MNQYNSNKLKELIHEQGFCPDGDLLEFGELVIEECIKVLHPSDNLSSMIEREYRNVAIRMLKQHFYGKPVRQHSLGALPPGWLDSKGTLQDGSEG